MLPRALRDHLRRHVDADHRTGLANLACSEERVEARAAPEVEHAFAGLQSTIVCIGPPRQSRPRF